MTSTSFPAVKVVGDGDLTIIALHGIQGTRSSWAAVAERTAAGKRFVLPNLRGRGRATRGITMADYGLDAYADDVAAVVERHAGRRHFLLAGWSMGVSVALEYVRLSKGPLPMGMVLVSGTPCLSEVRWFSATGVALMTEVAKREARLGLHEAADHLAVAHTWTAISSTDQRDMLHDIDIPTLVLHGRDDEDCPWSHGTWLAGLLPRANLVTIENAGHNLLAQATDEVAGAIHDFTARIGRTGQIA